MNEIPVKEIVAKFDLPETYVDYIQNQDGHINRTFEIHCRREDGTQKRYILQRINTAIFTMPVALMENISRVTDYLRKKIREEGGDPERETLRLVPAKDGKIFYVDTDGSYYRMYHYIEGAIAYQTAERPALFQNSARAFGRFQKQLADYPADSLAETIPHFHDTPKRFRDFHAAIDADTVGRKASVQKEIDFYLKQEQYAARITDAIAEGEIPLRVTHNDTKLNNVMLDAKTDEPVCVIDLDTVMPGSALYDFGDSIRFGASSGAEDEKNLDSIFMREELFEAYTEGYLTEAKHTLNDAEITLLPMSAVLMTLECGIRFLGDYLNGDTYFHISYPEQNLDRARTQAKLVADMLEKLPQMDAIVAKYAK